MPDRPALDPVEQRVLGALLEKQRTVPDTYPLSLNGLRTACNQSTSREPVVAYDESTLVEPSTGSATASWSGSSSPRGSGWSSTTSGSRSSSVSSRSRPR